MTVTSKKLLTLTGLFTVLMSLPWLVPHLGWCALAGLVPLLEMDRIAREEKVPRFWWWYYGAFVLWNAVTTFWICNATVGGGIAAVLANALQMALIFALYRAGRKILGAGAGMAFLAVMWIAWERFYFDAEISWPWLTLGGAFARSTRLVQWYEYTGTLGGSLWIWLCNISLYSIIDGVRSGRFSRAAAPGPLLSLCAYTALVCVPMICSASIYKNYDEDRSDSIAVTIVQPNFDPYHKFEKLSQAQQTGIYLDLARKALEGYVPEDAPSLLLAPETFTSDVVTNDMEGGATRNRFVEFLQDYPGLNILYGASSRDYLVRRSRPSYTAREIREGLWIESHNSALVTDASGNDQIYHKNKLVIGTEYLPYPRIMSRIDDALGTGLGRCVGDGEAGILTLHSPSGEQVDLGCAICYESVFGDFCRGYVQKGARAMTIITNDAWWGNTPGYLQHLSYASLRAIELRRDIARCANTGISAIIDQRGDIVCRSSWWQGQTLQGRIYLSDKQTFFVRHGDTPGRLCTFLFLMLLLLAIVRKLTSKLK